MLKKEIILVICFILISVQTSISAQPSSSQNQDLSNFLDSNTGMRASGNIQGVTELPNGGINIESADSLTTPNDVTVSNVRNTDISSEGNFERVGYLEHNNNRFHTAQDLEFTGEENFNAEFIESFQSTNFVLSNAYGVKFENGTLTADHADSFLKAGSIGSNIDNLYSTSTSFSVEKADSVISSCVKVQDVKNSEFDLFNDAIKIKADKGIQINIIDCSENDVKFNSNNGNVLLNKEVPTTYNIPSRSFYI